MSDSLPPAAGPPSSGRPDRMAELERLVLTHQLRLYRFILRRVGSPDDAADLTQQTFLAAYRSLDNFRGAASMTTWLFGIALTLLRNFRSRAVSRRYVHQPIDELLSLPDCGADPEMTASGRERLRHLLEALRTLPSDMQEVVMLVCIEDMSYEDTASLLDVPIGTVRSRLSRARTRLREALSLPAAPWPTKF